ncbi:hypothetical protein MCOR27_009085 [Pyricularia oryzae]|uniref:Uncharacterized protein n=4 Tax=Pyricularia oryzae TaxID=318829 RepID=G4N472_PYRO7|nr:uncharacterized protein MGG_16863 [Pyricularia oryzae 70-15]ELQ40289.1 hypothetical protein OOU_Y34scaffold00451g15 [Pyricularia oryzae Y34]KAH8847983.1 hypothetical protein MCOR01_001375 [Pyricularia oryzae]EHA52792.1 hypothetical protein MGG_16863 [Pyricularia oryzae 70-15]KAI6270867.1 hypothetical protein MCOR27_009085 [Pyricularia oryzae]KAI6308725.1 hypothetical protein MCOR34_007101 [Pyricularia oryzae]
MTSMYKAGGSVKKLLQDGWHRVRAVGMTNHIPSQIRSSPPPSGPEFRPLPCSWVLRSARSGRQICSLGNDCVHSSIAGNTPIPPGGLVFDLPCTASAQKGLIPKITCCNFLKPIGHARYLLHVTAIHVELEQPSGS